MRRLAVLLIVGCLAFPVPVGAVERESITLRDVGEAVHELIDLYQQTQEEVRELKRENKSLKKQLSDLERKFTILKMEQDLTVEKISAGEKEQEERKMGTPTVEVVPPDGKVRNSFPWITFKRSDVQCSLPERTERGYVYYNVLVSRNREGAVNFARNLARVGFCTVVRKIPDKKPLYRVVVIPGEGTREKLRSMGLNYYPYVRKLDLTKSSGGRL